MNFYNEIDAKAAAWLRELIKAGMIPDGVVDERSIADVRTEDLAEFHQCHFFAGIGGWSHALRLAGIPDDVRLWTGSCPCQPFSAAGKRRGVSDERHLWPIWFRLIAECKPPIVFGEQVASRGGREWLAGVRSDLERVGYRVGAADLPAACVGAPHIRQRLFFVGSLADATGLIDRGAPRPGETSFPSGQSRRDGKRIAGVHSDRDRGAGTSGGRREEALSAYGELPIANGQRCPQRSQQDGDSQPELEAPRWGNACRCGACAGLVSHAQRPDERLREPGEQGPATEQRRDRLAEYGATGDLSDANRAGRRELCGAVAVPSEQSGAERRGYWSEYDIIRFADRKARRIEPGLSPLAHGVPARVVRLRGYGNAIVPQVAATFIRCAFEAIGDCVDESDIPRQVSATCRSDGGAQ